MADAPEGRQDLASVDTHVKMNGNDRIQLRNITAQATFRYSVKDYNVAADLYSQATELQAKINGEMSTQNADLLYAYGRCLYHVAVGNSDVLGSKVASEGHVGSQKNLGSKKQKKQETIDEADGQQKRNAEKIVIKAVEENDGSFQPDTEADKRSKPYFQFTGDENFDTSGGWEEEEKEEEEEEEDEGSQADAENADEDDDFVNAYEILDLARVILIKKLEEIKKSSGNGKEMCESQDSQLVKERLADTYDLQAEISLEGERFPDAVMDLKSALELKKGLFPQESSLVAEAHFKLSLALELSSGIEQKDENGESDSNNDAHYNESMREEAALEMEEAIASCRIRIEKEKAILFDHSEADRCSGKTKVTKGDIADVTEMIKEMEQRLVELRQPPVSINDHTGTETIDKSNPLSGILGSILGESPVAQKARLEEASKGAKDLTKFIKRKKPAEGEASKALEPHDIRNNGKRKVGFGDEVEELGAGKRAKVSGSVED